MVTLREYAEGDWGEICRVHDRARPDELRGSCDPRAFVPLAEDPEAEDVHTSRKFVACEDGRVVGFVGVDGSYLSYLYVDPDHYGRGVGRSLLRRGLQLAGSGIHTVALNNNARAIGLYESEGFEVTDTYACENAGYPTTCLRLELRPWTTSNPTARAPTPLDQHSNPPGLGVS